MKKLFPVFCILIIALFFSGCSYKPVTENGNRFFKDMSRSIQYEYDYNWKIDGISSSNSFFTIHPKEADGIELYCNLAYSYDKPQNEEENFEIFKQELNGLYADAVILSETSGKNAYDHPFFELVYTFTDETGAKTTYCDRFILISNLTAYASGRSPAEKYEENRKSYDIFFDSLTYYR